MTTLTPRTHAAALRVLRLIETIQAMPRWKYALWKAGLWRGPR